MLRRGRRLTRLNPPLIEAGSSPKLPGNFERIDASLFPPRLLVAHAMHLAMMDAAERDHEFNR
jgi:hypothetical protein